jgi:PleD family two-component response regulator
MNEAQDFDSSSEVGSDRFGESGPGLPGLRRPQRILVVDEATFNRKLLLSILRTKEHNCKEAENGRGGEFYSFVSVLRSTVDCVVTRCTA